MAWLYCGHRWVGWGSRAPQNFDHGAYFTGQLSSQNQVLQKNQGANNINSKGYRRDGKLSHDLEQRPDPSM